MEDPRVALQPYLVGNEVLRWTARPRQGFALYPRDVFLIPFSLFFAGFSVFWIYGASEGGGLFALFGVPFVAAGLYLLVGRFVVDAWVRSSTIYGLTDRRALILRRAFGVKFTAVDLAGVRELRLSPGRDGAGTIEFGPAASIFDGRAQWGYWTPALDDQPRFFGIPDVAAVYRRVEDAKRLGAS